MLFEPDDVIVVSKRAGAAPIPEGYTEILIDRTTVYGNNEHRDTRNRSIAAHRTYVNKKMKRSGYLRKQLRLLAERIHKGEKIALVCWCKPKPCHGDNYKTVLDNLVKELKSEASNS